MSATADKTIGRKIAICAKHDCLRCPVSENRVPDDCEWAMKHILCTQEEGRVIDMPRRSGKTTRILNLAASLADVPDTEVIVFVPVAQLASQFQKVLMGTGVQVMSVGGWKTRDPSVVKRVLASRRGVLVLSDEVHPWIAREVKKMKHHRFVLGCYSSVG